MQSLDERIDTFINKGWDYCIPVSVDELCSAGFYYTGIYDWVACFHCSLCLRVRDSRDQPLTAHTMFSSNCYFLKLCKIKTFFQNNSESEDEDYISICSSDYSSDTLFDEQL
jgi:hypothetical protein